MGSQWLHDIGYALEGLPVLYYSGWETRSRSSGGFDDILAIGVHHTASDTTPESDMGYMWTGSPDRPVGNIYLARDGVITVGAAGASNTMGKGGPLECFYGTIPKDAGNKFMIAIEAANNGVGEPWSSAQTDSYVQLVRQLCEFYQLSVGQDVYGHFDYCAPSCPGRKVDPAGPSPFGSVNANGTWDINAFRSAVAGDSSWAPDPDVPPVPTPEPPPSGNRWEDDLMNSLPTLVRGHSGHYVNRMQHLLAAAGFMNEANVSNYDGVFGSGTENALSRFKEAAGGIPDGICDPWAWGALMHTIDGIPELVYGTASDDVKRMQHLLAAHGYMKEANVSNYDGVWGDGTEGAKQRFDNDYGLTPSPPTDCGKKSWTALLNG
ncbi:MAG: N-acetylmuramoyl-L-alanine amidase [Paenisporosarcina sp.]